MADITVQFGDGSSHVYTGVPDNVTPDQVEARAKKDFTDKQITHLDRKAAAAPEKKSDGTKGSVLGEIKGAGEAVLSMGSAAVSGLGGAVARTLNRSGEGLAMAEGGQSFEDADKNRKEIEQKINAAQDKATYTPKTDAGKRDLGVVGTVTRPVTYVMDKAHQGLEKTVGKEAADTISDVATIGTSLLGGEELTAAKGIRAATKGIKASELSADAAKAADSAAAAQKAGYVLPSRMTKPGKLSEVTNYVVGKEKLNDAMSARNQTTTNNLVKEGLGLKADATLDQETMHAVRTEAGKDYEAIKSLTNPNVKTGTEYTKALDKIADARKGGISKVRADDPVVKMVDELKANPNFTTEQALNEIRSLRDESDKFYRQGDKAIGKSYKQAADAIEGAIQKHLEDTKAPSDLVQKYKDARQRIANSYTIEKALDGKGNVSAIKLAKELQKGKPLAGGTKTAAQFGQKFADVARVPTEDSKWVSLMKKAVPVGTADVGMRAAEIAGHGALGLKTAGASLVARPLVRAAMNTKAYQKTIGKARTAAEETAHRERAAKIKQKAAELGGRYTGLSATQYNDRETD